MHIDPLTNIAWSELFRFFEKTKIAFDLRPTAHVSDGGDTGYTQCPPAALKAERYFKGKDSCVPAINIVKCSKIACF